MKLTKAESEHLKSAKESVKLKRRAESLEDREQRRKESKAKTGLYNAVKKDVLKKQKKHRGKTRGKGVTLGQFFKRR